jgi:hypothetical protein
VHRLERAGAADGVVGRGVGAFQAHVEPHQLPSAEGAGDVLGDQQAVRRQTGVQPAPGGGVQDVEQVLAEEWLAPGQSEPERPEPGEVAEEALQLPDREWVVIPG